MNLFENKSRTVYLILLIFSLSACGGGSDNSLPTDEKTKLEGSWFNNCGATGRQWATDKFVFTNNQFKRFITIYNGANCSGTGAVTLLQGSFVLGDSLTATNGFQANKIIFTFENGKFYTIVAVLKNELYFGQFASTLENTPNAVNFNFHFVLQ